MRGLPLVMMENWLRVWRREDSRLRLVYVSDRESGGQLVGFRAV